MSVTLIIIILTAAVSFLAWQQPPLLNKLIYHGPTVSKGEYWRLITHGFIHGDGNHLLFNMFTLYFFGSSMETVLVPAIGVTGFVLFYLMGILVAILPTHLRHRKDARYRSLGASGAVSAMLFAYIFLKPWSMLFVMFVPVPAVIFAVLYIGYSFWAGQRRRDNVNHSAHLAGALWGIAFLLVLQPNLLPRFFTKLTQLPF
jgi:membrane associated rhomboid family serine protease